MSKIVVVDDNNNFLNQIEDSLIGIENIDFKFCKNISELYVNEKPINMDLIVMDYDLNDTYNGVQVVKDLYEKGYSGHVIFISGEKLDVINNELDNYNLVNVSVLEKGGSDFFEKLEKEILDKKKDRVESIKHRINSFLDVVEGSLFEREEVSRLLIFCVFASANIFMYGPPGTGKSDILKYIKKTFSKLKYFRYLMTDFTKFDDIFGEVIEDENGKKTRIIDGKLLTAHIAFFDEVFKANDSILNSLLTVLHEKIFDDVYASSTQSTISVPLVCAIGASNEFPRTKYLNALFERFPIRIPVLNIEQRDNIIKVFNAEFNVQNNKLPDFLMDDLDFVNRNWVNTKNSQKVENDFFELLSKIDKRLNPQNETGDKIYQFSTRTMAYTGVFIRKMAFLNNRKVTDESDLMLLKYIAWNNMRERAIVAQVIDQYYFGDRKNIIETIGIDLKECSQINERVNSEFFMYINKNKKLNKDSFNEFVDALAPLIVTIKEKIMNMSNYIKVAISHKNLIEKLENNIFISEVDLTPWNLSDEKYIVEKNDNLGTHNGYEDKGYIIDALIEYQKVFEEKTLMLEKFKNECDDFFYYEHSWKGYNV